MSITTDNLAEFVDRLTDLKRALAQLNDAGTADRHLIGLETVANAARALFDDDKQTTALRLFKENHAHFDMEPMIETGNGGYAYMDELAKYRIYGLHDVFNYESATFICHDGELWRCVQPQEYPYQRNAALAVKHKLVPVSRCASLTPPTIARLASHGQRRPRRSRPAGGSRQRTSSVRLRSFRTTASCMARSGTNTGGSAPCSRLSARTTAARALPKKKTTTPLVASARELCL